MDKQRLLEPFQLFTHRECQEIIRDCLDNPEQAGTTRAGRLEDVRNNYVWWKNYHYDRLWNIMTNIQGYNVTWLETFQISRYRTGEFYDWHTDGNDASRRSSVRLLTLTCTLRTAKGAVLETKDRVYNLPPGYAVIFEHNTEHRATAPVQGERWSFTVWGMTPNTRINSVEEDNKHGLS